ncbi:tetraspanin-17-like [Acanthaster planci]|uniref:Tetraspanin-33 n=1 Tax=Acanthaster planci TaxID=133434 RepID=A0A8B7Y2U0_ACAPL|nr:tetraspanin-17-like [Acanthaster planci]
MYPQGPPPPYNPNHPEYSQHMQPYHQHDYPPPATQPPAQQQLGPVGYPGQLGPKPGHGGRSRTGDPSRAQPNKGQGQRRSQPPPKQQQRQAQPKQRARPAVKDYSEISLFIKYFLFFANFFFWLAGCGCIAVGIWAWNDRGAFGDLDVFLSSSPLVDPVLWFMVVGGIIFVLATFGCIGALRENIVLLKIYSGLLGLILLLEIGGGVAIYFYRAEIEERIAGFLTDVAVKNYRSNEDLQDIIDALQSGLSCCGVKDYNDWNMNIYFNCSEAIVGQNTNPEACGVPFSCCMEDPASGVVNTQCGYNVRKPDRTVSERSHIYSSGCLNAFKGWLQTNLVVVAIAAGVIVLVEVFGFCFSTSLVSDIKRQKARWRH